MAYEAVENDLTQDRVVTIRDLCIQRGFSVDEFGNIYVGRKRRKMDNADPEMHTIDGTTLLKPVGFVGRSAELVYTEEKGFLNYHSELREIFSRS